MNDFEATVRAIRNLEIQGASNIARAGVQALADALAEHPDAERAADLAAELYGARPNEPMLRNLVGRYLAAVQPPVNRSPSSMRAAAEELLVTLARELDEVAAIGARLVAGKSTVFTHCHASTVTRALRLAQEQGSRFTVYCTETRPRYQGRVTATELAAAGIPVVHSVDSAALLGLREAELVLLGADAVLATGFFINKVGSSLIAFAAEHLGVPLYVVTHSLKFDTASVEGADEPIEQRPAEEVWPNAPAGIAIRNPAFERVPVRHVQAFVTEHGLLDLHGLQERALAAQRGGR